MNRVEFLKKLLGAAALVFLPGNLQKKSKSTTLLKFDVRGFQFYRGASLIDNMKAGEPLALMREATNKYDENAIAVHYAQEKIGFVPREKNEVLSRLMDSGIKTLRAEIIKVRDADNPWNAVSARIYLET